MSGVVDRLLAQLPGLQTDSPVAPPSRGGQWATTPSTPAVREAPASHGQLLLGVWLRVVLGLALGVMMGGWPYVRSCGTPLVGYLAALLTLVLAGVWAARASWRHRAALAHVVSLIFLFYGLVLIAAELLPRTGYAVDQATWQCEESAWSAGRVTASIADH